MALLLNLTIGIYEDQWVMISRKDCFFAKNAMVSLLQCLHQTIELLVIGVVINFGLHKSL